MPLLFSVATDPTQLNAENLAGFDLLDPHIWMVQQNGGEFYKLSGYAYERFDPKGYTNLSLKADDVYRARPEYWQSGLLKIIDAFADIARKIKMPRITTECWAIVDYKDFPLLKWEWVKEVCAIGARRAASTG